MTTQRGPLHGLKVLDLSIIVAGGTASSLLADFGAEVVKVERPGIGDSLRNWGPFYNGVSLWWKVHSRNKKSITLNMDNAQGQQLLLDLAGKADILIEGFRPGTLERWGLGPDDLHRVNPGLVILRFLRVRTDRAVQGPARFRHHRRVHERLHRHDRIPRHPAGIAAGTAGR